MKAVPLRASGDDFTLRFPSMDRASAFFRDAAALLTRLRQHLEAGGVVAWPAAGIGPGLAQLPERSPRCWSALERARGRLEGIGRVADASARHQA